MKTLSKLALASTLVASLVGGVAFADKTTKPATPAQPPAAAPATTTEPAKADVAKFLVFFDKFVDLAVADQADCSKMAVDLNAHIDANQPILKVANDSQAKGQKLPADAAAHMTTAAKRLQPAMANCSKDQKVQAVFARLPHGGSSHK